MRQKSFNDHFWMFYDFLAKDTPFALSRFSDGELFIMQGIEVKLDDAGAVIGSQKIHSSSYKRADHKHFHPQQHVRYQKLLIKAFQYKKRNYYKGISCRCCVGQDNFDWQILLHGGDDESLTWANIWINANYSKFIKFVLPLLYSKKVVFVGHEHADLSKLPFIVRDFRVGYNAMINDYDKIAVIESWIENHSIRDHVFIFSASSFSNLAIHRLYAKYEGNTYIDIGTCLSPLINMPDDRDYLKKFWSYQNLGDVVKQCIW